MELQKQLTSITEDIVTELDAKLKDAGYSSTSNKKAKEALDTALEKIKNLCERTREYFQGFFFASFAF